MNLSQTTVSDSEKRLGQEKSNAPGGNWNSGTEKCIKTALLLRYFSTFGIRFEPKQGKIAACVKAITPQSGFKGNSYLPLACERFLARSCSSPIALGSRRMPDAFSILSSHARKWVLRAKGWGAIIQLSVSRICTHQRAGATGLKANPNPRILPARFTFTEATI